MPLPPPLRRRLSKCRTHAQEYVDQICVSAYNMCGARYADSKSFAHIFGYAYAQLTSFTAKPLCIAEMSTTSWCGSKASQHARRLMRRRHGCARTMRARSLECHVICKQ
jgi:hypothetical protein